ncbi:MAG: helix-turn-helix domain-containing protein [Clostridia bacterium]|nr:helix-turn-helix domain-containing protein [Clostridia bacterium]
MLDGKYLKDLRIKNNYRVEELEKILHVSRATIYRWERENSLRDNDLINALAKLYGMTAKQLTDEAAVTADEAEEIAPEELTETTEEKPAKKQLSLVKIGAITAASTFMLFAIITAIIILCVCFQQDRGNGEAVQIAYSTSDILAIVGIAVACIIVATTATVLIFYFIRKRRKEK